MNDLRIPGWVRELSPQLGAKGGPVAPQPSGHQRKESRAVAVSASMPGRWRRTPAAPSRAVTQPLFLPQGRPTNPTLRTLGASRARIFPRAPGCRPSVRAMVLPGVRAGAGAAATKMVQMRCRVDGSERSQSPGPGTQRAAVYVHVSGKEEAQFGGQGRASRNPHSDFSPVSRHAYFPHP